MINQIFVNLPVKDLQKSIAFFTKVGFTFNPKFTNEHGTCMIIGENIFAMLLVHTHFTSFTKKPIADTAKGAEVILAVAVDSKEQVDEYVQKAVTAGATTPMENQDHGWMYSKGFQDPDGHLWEIFWMDEKAMPKQ
ncbi:MAG: VOC family protein [Candidatus Peribacteraceae bacterium]|nr:VOC family protein [Candidatus Peribacteraceae bacterium]